MDVTVPRTAFAYLFIGAKGDRPALTFTPDLVRVGIGHTQDKLQKHGLAAVLEAETENGAVCLYLTAAQAIDLAEKAGLVAEGIMRAAEAEAEKKGDLT